MRREIQWNGWGGGSRGSSAKILAEKKEPRKARKSLHERRRGGEARSRCVGERREEWGERRERGVGDSCEGGDLLKLREMREMSCRYFEQLESVRACFNARSQWSDRMEQPSQEAF